MIVRQGVAGGDRGSVPPAKPRAAPVNGRVSTGAQIVRNEEGGIRRIFTEVVRFCDGRVDEIVRGHSDPLKRCRPTQSESDRKIESRSPG